jgi:uncharacterized MnhB-related membrane protein
MEMALAFGIHLVLLIVLFVFMMMAVEYEDLVKAAISLALGSAVLALIFYGFDSPMAGIVELSVGAGLITVLLMSTISVLGDKKEEG